MKIVLAILLVMVCLLTGCIRKAPPTEESTEGPNSGTVTTDPADHTTDYGSGEAESDPQTTEDGESQPSSTAPQSSSTQPPQSTTEPSSQPVHSSSEPTSTEPVSTQPQSTQAPVIEQPPDEFPIS